MNITWEMLASRHLLSSTSPIHLDIHFVDHKWGPKSAQKSISAQMACPSVPGQDIASSWQTLKAKLHRCQLSRLRPCFLNSQHSPWEPAEASTKPLLTRLPGTRVAERPRWHEIVTDIANQDQQGPRVSVRRDHKQINVLGMLNQWE